MQSQLRLVLKIFLNLITMIIIVAIFNYYLLLILVFYIMDNSSWNHILYTDSVLENKLS